ncbi:unnamed protein product, partial [marine sediment metagenome]
IVVNSPDTGLPWTLAELDALEAGLRNYDSGVPSGIWHDAVASRVNWGALIIVAPTVTTNPATNVVANSATLKGTLTADGGEACECGFEWGETVPYDNTTEPESKTTGQTFSQAIGGLVPGTTYHFRAFATNAAGTRYGSDRTFTTLAAPPLVINKSYALAREEL